jgi:FixJ family two-component response regulator
MSDVLAEAGSLHRELQPLEDRARQLAESLADDDLNRHAADDLAKALSAATRAAFALGNSQDPTG